MHVHTAKVAQHMQHAPDEVINTCLGVRVYATALLSAANRNGSTESVGAFGYAVAVLVRGLSTELEVVRPRVSRSLMIAATAVAYVTALPSLRVRPVSVSRSCKQRILLAVVKHTHKSRQ